MWPVSAELILICSTLRYRNKTHKLLCLGYIPILRMIEYSFHGYVYDKLVANNFFSLSWYEKSVNISYDTPTGILVEMEKEPITCLRMMMKRGIGLNKDYIQMMANIRAFMSLDYIIECLGPKAIVRTLYDNMVNAGKKGHLNCLKFYSEWGVDCTPAFLQAIKHGHLECVRWLEEHNYGWIHSSTEPCYTAKKTDIRAYLSSVGYTMVEFDDDKLSGLETCFSFNTFNEYDIYGALINRERLWPYMQKDLW